MEADDNRTESSEKAVISRGPIPVVTSLLVANVVIFIALLGAPYLGLQHLALWPLGVETGMQMPPGMAAGEFRPWQLVTYAFLHGGLLHLFINMFVLWMFGSAMERAWGSSTFALYYGVCILGAGVVQLLMTSSGLTPAAPALGASGGVFAILLAFGMTFPNQVVVLLIPPIPMKAKYFVVLIGIVELVVGVTGTQQGVANFAHLAGMVFGLLFILALRPSVKH